MQIKHIFFYWLPVYGYMGLIFYLSSQGALSSFLSLPYDKLSHFLEYAFLGLLLLRALNKTFPEGNPIILGIVAWSIGAAYAASDEFHQSFVPGRNADALDWLADSLGAAIGSSIIFKKG